jgi:uncharacterized protein YprB with RNaseH-like and TPR domain
LSTLADRLRGVMGGVLPARSTEVASLADLEARAARTQAAHEATAGVLGGDWRESHGHRFLVVDRKYLPGHRHGRVAIADALPPSDGGWPALPLLAGGACGGNLLFVDLETTGLGGGAGTYAFLVGCAWFDGGTFRIRQFFLSSYAAERALLQAVSELAEASGTVVTYNGKSFDLPLIETRFLYHRIETPFAGLPHVDMLHPARRLWRSDEDSGHRGPTVPAYGEREPGEGRAGVATLNSGCRLSNLEEMLCGHTREGDVPGFEIPGRYFEFVRSGDARPLEAVLEHNRLDLLSLALITARAAQLLDDGPALACSAREALGLGRLYERGGMTAEAGAAFARASGMDGGRELAGDTATRAEALRAYALLLRRQRRYQEAATAWQRLLDLKRAPASIVREATEALAVHHEHRLRDPHAARAFALKSLQVRGSAARTQALHHRLARLNRKLGEPPAPLF